MKYYEIWFYYYGENDEKTDYTNEFTFYIKIDKDIKNKSELVDILKERMYGNNVEAKEYRYWLEQHLDNISNWFEISAKDFTDGCGVPA